MRTGDVVGECARMLNEHLLLGAAWLQRHCVGVQLAIFGVETIFISAALKRNCKVEFELLAAISRKVF